MSFIFCILMFCHLGALLPLPGLPVPSDNKQVTREHTFQKQTSQPRALTPPPPPWGSHTLGHCLPALITQGRYQTTKDILCAPQPAGIIQTGQCSACLPREVTREALAHVFPLFPLPPDQPWCFPVWPGLASPAPSSWEL